MPEETKGLNGYFNGNGSAITNSKKVDSNNSFSNSSSPRRTPSPTLTDSYSYETVTEIACFLLERTHFRPKIGIICGSGLGHLAENLTEVDSFPYEEIPNFPLSTVEGHAGRMVFGFLNGIEVMCMQGRFHYYEGYALSKCSMPVRVMKLCGCTNLIATNAAGGLNSDYNVGDIMIFKDHVNIMGFAGNSPLQGPNDHRFGPRFPPMSKAYDPKLIETAQNVAKDMGIENQVKTGVYTCLGGPNYETVAELKMWRILGVDAIGMSTVHEVITARHCDLKVFAFSLITNKCIVEYDTHEEANHEEVIDTGSKFQHVLTQFVTNMIEKINDAM